MLVLPALAKKKKKMAGKRTRDTTIMKQSTFLGQQILWEEF